MMMITTTPFSFLTILFLPLVTSELSFTPVLQQQDRQQQQHRSLRGNEGLNGLWGQFHQFGFCVEKIDDPSDDTSDKVKFSPCDSWEPKQMWKFENEYEYWNYTGLVYNMDGGRCLTVRGTVEAGKNLKVMDCNPYNNKQQWWSDGDSLTLLETQDLEWDNWLCVQAEQFPIHNRDPVVLTECSDSLDY